MEIIIKKTLIITIIDRCLLSTSLVPASALLLRVYESLLFSPPKTKMANYGSAHRQYAPDVEANNTIARAYHEFITSCELTMSYLLTSITQTLPESQKPMQRTHNGWGRDYTLLQNLLRRILVLSNFPAECPLLYHQSMTILEERIETLSERNPSHLLARELPSCIWLAIMILLKDGLLPTMHRNKQVSIFCVSTLSIYSSLSAARVGLEDFRKWLLPRLDQNFINGWALRYSTRYYE